MLNFRILQLLCLSLCLSQAWSSDCNLIHFPNTLYYSDILSAQSSIEDYVIDEFPQASADLTHPLQLQHTFNSVTPKRFVEGYPFPLFVSAIEEESTVHFQMWNLTTESLQNTSIKYVLPRPSQCRYFSIQQLAYNDVFIHCENATHHRHYSIEWLFSPSTSIDELKVALNGEVASKVEFYRLKASAYRNNFRVVRSNDQGIIQLYHYRSSTRPYSGNDFITEYKDWVEKQTGLTNNQYIGYVGVNGLRGAFDVYLLKNQGILFAYEGLYYDRWNLAGQTITKILGFVDQNTVAAITKTHIYFLSVWANQRSEYRLVVKELAKIQLKGISYTEVFNLGEFIVLAGNQLWNVFYLKENSIKFFKFSTPLLLKDIAIDGFSIESSFFMQNQQYLLRKPLLKTSEVSSSKITLKTSKCQQTLNMKRFNNKQVEVVNENSDLVWRNGIIEKTNIICQGNNISSSLFTNGKTINISKLNSFHPNLPSDTTEIMNFTMITQELTAFVTRVNSVVHIISCYRNETCKIIETYDEITTPKLISEARINIFNVSLAKGQAYDEFPDLEKQLLVTVVWNMSRLYFTSYTIKTNTIKLAGGWQSLTMKFNGFETIGYSPAKKEECSTNSGLVANLVVYVEKAATNNWSHYTSSRNGVDITMKSDILFGFKRMCSISNSNMKFLLYEYEGNSLKLKLIYDREDYYHEIGLASFDNLLSRRAICSRMGLAVINGSEIFFVSEDIFVTRTLKLSSSAQNDKISGSLLLHSNDASTTQIYNAETGFLIQSLNVPLAQIVITKQSNSFALKNGSILHFSDLTSFPLVQPEDYALLTCFNTISSISKLKKIRTINDLNLPNQVQLQNWERFDKNVWNATVRSLQGVTSLSMTQNITHFSKKERPPWLKYFAEQNFFYRQIFGEYLQIAMTNTYCMRETQSPSFTYYLEIYSKYFSWSGGQARPDSDTTFGLSNLYQNNISIASWNESAINFMTLSFNEKNLSDVQVTHHSCPVEVWIEDQFYMTRKIDKDSNHIYLMRHEIELWNSYYSVSNDWVKQYADLPRRFVIDKPKLQIFTLGDRGECMIHEITSESLGISEQIKDFATFVRQDTTFVFILTNTQVIVQKNLNQSNRFSAKISKQFVKMDVRFDMLLLISENDNSEIYNIIWQAFPLAGTLELNFTLTHTQENSKIIGGVIMFYGAIIASQHTLVFYLFQEKSTLYSLQSKPIQDFQTFYRWTLIDAIQYKDRETILLQYYTSYAQFNTVEVTVSFTLNADDYDKLIASNEKDHKEYTRKANRNGTEKRMSLMTE